MIAAITSFLLHNSNLLLHVTMNTAACFSLIIITSFITSTHFRKCESEFPPLSFIRPRAECLQSNEPNKMFTKYEISPTRKLKQRTSSFETSIFLVVCRRAMREKGSLFGYSGTTVASRRVSAKTPFRAACNGTGRILARGVVELSARRKRPVRHQKWSLRFSTKFPIAG